MPLAISHDPQHWLARAAETRAMAEKIVDPEELAEAGECDADRICEQVLSEIRGWRFQVSFEQQPSRTFGPLPHALR
jgi:hypothetical protein